jgi:hypothetical protein
VVVISASTADLMMRYQATVEDIIASITFTE